MTAYYGVQNTKAISATPSTDNIVEPGFYRMKEYVMTDSYECAATAAADTIAIGYTLPEGAIITGAHIAWDDLGDNSITLELGDSDDPDRYIAAVDADAAAGSSDTIRVDGLGYEIGTNTGDSQILVTQGGDQAATGTVKVTIRYAWM